MSRSVVAAVALAAAALACTSAKTTSPGTRLREPSAVAVFRGRTIAARDEVKPYLVVANAFRNDLSVVDAITDLPVPSPIVLQTLVLPVADRPALLAAASLGDGKPDLLVAVSAGDSVLQVVETWDSLNTVRWDPTEAGALAVDLGEDVVAIAAMPSVGETARLAVALANRRLAVVSYARVAGGDAIALAGPPLSTQFDFQAEAIAAMPDGDPDPAVVETAIYAATLDPIDGVYGVAEVAADLSGRRALGARAPTRLVAAARLRERLPGSAESGEAAFAADAVPRVYAVLDEAAPAGCGPSGRIDCGVVVLDPTDPSPEQAIPDDPDDSMTYRAPMRIGGRPLALAVSGPPEVAHPPATETETPVPQGLLRLYMGAIVRATTGVAAVPSDDGNVYFLDLGRYETATSAPAITNSPVGSPRPSILQDRRLWLLGPDGSFVADAEAAKNVTATPGFTPVEGWSVTWQPVLPDLSLRAGEADELGGDLWLALQVGRNDVVKLWHPALGVRAGDVLVVKARGVPGCTGTVPFGGSAASEKEFELEVMELLPPTAAYPGGAVRIVEPPPPADPGASDPWGDCYRALAAAAAGSNVATGLTVTVRAGELALLGQVIGYAGRPQLGQVGVPASSDPPYAIGYQDEDALEGACALDAWEGGLPVPACDAGCRSACESLALVRKLRRVHHLSVNCATDPAAGKADACNAAWPGNAFPAVSGTTALAFRVAVQPINGKTDATELRGLTTSIATSSGVAWLAVRPQGTSPYGANGAVAFDRSPWTATEGYRFFVSFPSDFVLDTSPGLSPAPANVIR